MRIEVHFAYGWHTNAKDVECMKDAIRRFKPHIVLGESAYMPREATIELERKYELARQRNDIGEIRRMFSGDDGTATLSGIRVDVSRPIIQFCVESEIRFMYDESWTDTREALRKIAENQLSGRRIQSAMHLFLNCRVREAIVEYRAAIEQRIGGLLERDENSHRRLVELVSVLPKLKDISGLEVVRILNRVGLYHLGRFERVKTDDRFGPSCSFETTPPVFGRAGGIMARGGLGLETDLSDENIMRVLVGDLIVNQFNPMTTWSPLFIATTATLVDMLEEGKLRDFGAICTLIGRRANGVPRVMRAVIFLSALSEVFGVPLPPDEEQMRVFVQNRVPEFTSERTEFGRETDLREVIRDGRIIE